MRCLSVIFLSVFSMASWASVASEKLESLTSQVSPFWKTIKPACVMAQDPELQAQLASRLNYLDEKLIASELQSALSENMQDSQAIWGSPLWAEQLTLEKNALEIENREPLREYFFKLQTQAPNPERSELVRRIQYMSETLNYTLRKEIWKTCHALGFTQMPTEQIESAVQQRWSPQDKKVQVQIKRELAAFYFYSFRQTSNAKLQEFANLGSPLKLWVQQSSQNMVRYFEQLRSELIHLPFVVIPDAVSEPFPEDHPWLPSPSQELLAP